MNSSGCDGRLFCAPLGCNVLSAVAPERLSLGRSARRAVSFVSVAFATALLSFHGWLLWTRASQGQLLDAAEALRWAAGAILFSVLLVLRRIGVPLFSGRKAAIFWLLVLLVHASALAAPAETAQGLAVGGAEWLFTLPVSVAPLGLALALVCGGALARGWRRSSFEKVLLVSQLAGYDALSAGFLRRLCPRPPPA